MFSSTACLKVRYSTIAIASFTRLSPKMMVYKLRSTCKCENEHKVATGSTAEISEPNISVSIILMCGNSTPKMPPTKHVEMSVPTMAKVRMEPRFVWKSLRLGFIS